MQLGEVIGTVVATTRTPGLDGVRFDVDREVVSIEGLDGVGETVYHVYDPRITAIEDRYVIVVAMDVDGACRLGTGVTEDFTRFTLVGYQGDRDSRNGVLFPERVGGRYLRLERTNDRDISGDAVCLAESDDLAEWRLLGPVFTGRPHYWDELVGSGPPPVSEKQTADEKPSNVNAQTTASRSKRRRRRRGRRGKPPRSEENTGRTESGDEEGRGNQ